MGNDESSPLIILFVILYGGETMGYPVPQWTSKQCMPLIDCIERNCTSLALDQMAFLDAEPLSGTIPSQIWHLMPQLENVLLGNNMLTGTIPKELVELPHLTYISVKNNLLHGDERRAWTISTTSMRITTRFRDTWKCRRCWVEILNWILWNSSILKTSRSIWRVWRRRFVPLISRSAISVDPFETIVDRKSNVIRGFTSSYSQLQGTIPSGIGELKDLMTLTLPGNNLKGQIPDTFVELVNLLSDSCRQSFEWSFTEKLWKESCAARTWTWVRICLRGLFQCSTVKVLDLYFYI